MTNNELNVLPIALGDALVALSAEVQRLKRGYQDAQNTEKFLIDLSTALAEKKYSTVLNTWEKQQDTILKCLDQSNIAGIEVNFMIQELKKQRWEDMQGFARKFPIVADSLGIKIDANSRHPNYYLMNGFIHISVNEKKFQISITPRMGKSILVGFEYDDIFKTLTSEVQRIFAREWDSLSFRKKLIEIYNAVSPRNSQSQSPEVLIKVIMKEFQSRHKMSPDEFLIDFSRLLKEDKGIQLGNTRDSENGIQIVGSESNGYYGYMRIEEL
jgi:hypothetical protein